MPLFRSALTWFRLTFRWSNSAQTWQERVADGVVLGVLAGALVYGWLLGLAWWWLLPFCLACLALPCLVLRLLGWLKVFGPVLYYDMIRTARQNRFVWLRFAYALVLVFLLFCTYLGMRRGVSSNDARQAAAMAQNYFELFMVAQFITVVLLTPAYVAGAVAEEKDRKTLEFMLATDLLNREIVLSKLGSRLANLALIVMTGLPILSILQFVGGIDPNMVVAGFIVTAMTIAGQAGVSILCSVTCKRPRDAIALAYLALVVYYGVSVGLMLAMFSLPGLAAAPVWFGDDPPIVQDLVDLYNKGSLITVITQVKLAGRAGTLAAVLPDLVRDYSIFHGALCLCCTLLAVARVRRVALVQMYGKPIKAPRTGRSILSRPPVSDHPMLWKEIECEGGGRMNWISVVIFSVLLGCTLIPALLIVVYHCERFYQAQSMYTGLVNSMNAWGRICNVVVGSLTLLAVAIRAATSITSERDKQTLDALLTSPLDSSTILHAKWFGSIFGLRMGMIWLAVIWAAGIVTGGLHIGAMLLLAVAWLIFAAFVASLGLWFSVVCKSSLRAVVMTILTTIGLGVGHWLVWLCCGFVVFASPGSGRSAEYVMKFQAGMTPPFVLGWLHFSADDFRQERWDRHREQMELTVFCMVGMVSWAVAAAGLYAVTSVRFRHLTNRAERMLSDRARGVYSPSRRPPPRAATAGPLPRPSGAIVLEEVGEETTEPLDHDDPSGWYRPRP
jgi:ABC-type transport system involved in multi-copper enzyme maturation permease subunit